MSTLELLEQSLNTVQADIRSCMEPAEQTTEDLSKALVPVEANVIADCDLGYSSERDEDLGQMSKILTDKGTYELDQYQQKLKERKSLRSRPGSGSIIRSRPNSGQSGRTRPKSGVRSRLSSANSSGIYSMDPSNVAVNEVSINQLTQTSDELTLVPYQQNVEETESAASSTCSGDTDSVLNDNHKSLFSAL